MEVTTKKGQKKIIRTYESHLRNTIEPYIMSMSKYLATLRFFPEYTGLGAKYKLGASKMLQLEAMVGNKDLGSYAKETIERLIGTHKANMQSSIAS